MDFVSLSLWYTNFNILYWSLVDIVDSFWDEPDLRQYIPYVMHIKGELFNLANADLDRLVPILKKYRFPNVQQNSSSAFMMEFSGLLESVSKKPQSDISKLVIYMVRKAAIRSSRSSSPVHPWSEARH